VVQVGGGVGRDIGAEGFVNLTADYRDRGFTNRSYADTRQQYFNGDPRNTDPALSGRSTTGRATPRPPTPAPSSTPRSPWAGRR
jgi:hypothetical protein